MNVDDSARMPARVSVAGPDDARAWPEIAALVGQLSRRAPRLTQEHLESLIRSDSCQLLIARDEADRVVGMLTLAVFALPTGLRARIEDVVVDAAHRRNGMARHLTLAAIRIARARGARNIDLTSNPSRQPAIRLYEGLGFSRRDTTVFRLDLNSP